MEIGKPPEAFFQSPIPNLRLGGAHPLAVWVCGCAASGKTQIGQSAILPLRFKLIDADQAFEDLLQKYRLSLEIPAPGAEQKEIARQTAAARRRAQQLIGTEGETIDLARLAERLAAAVTSGLLDRKYAEHLATEVRSKLGTGSVPKVELEKTIWPKMMDWADPLAYLEGKEISQDHLCAVAREITRRTLVQCQKERRNLLIVETGGETGKTLNTRTALKSAGYDTFLVWVDLGSVQDALRRNRDRRLIGGRSLHPEIIERSFRVSQESRARLLEAFQPFMLSLDNSVDGDAALAQRIEEARATVSAWMKR